MNTLRTQSPLPSEYAPFYQGYVDLVPAGDIIETLAQQHTDLVAFIRSIEADLADHRYAPGKWSIRQVLQHMLDAERIFTYRALRFSRGDATPLPGFEENAYADAARVDGRTLADLVDEFARLRAANLDLFRTFDEEELSRSGIASDSAMSVRALLHVIFGHAQHHKNVLQERYL